MLVLSRQRDESVKVSATAPGELTITVVDIRGDKVRLGFQCPAEWPVHRAEVYAAIQAENARATDLAAEFVSEKTIISDAASVFAKMLQMSFLARYFPFVELEFKRISEQGMLKVMSALIEQAKRDQVEQLDFYDEKGTARGHIDIPAQRWATDLQFKSDVPIYAVIKKQRSSVLTFYELVSVA